MKTQKLFQTTLLSFTLLIFISGQAPRKEPELTPSTKEELSQFKTEEIQEEDSLYEEPSKSAAQKAREEIPGIELKERKSAAKKCVEKESKSSY